MGATGSTPAASGASSSSFVAALQSFASYQSQLAELETKRSNLMAQLLEIDQKRAQILHEQQLALNRAVAWLTPPASDGATTPFATPMPTHTALPTVAQPALISAPARNPDFWGSFGMGSARGLSPAFENKAIALKVLLSDRADLNGNMLAAFLSEAARSSGVRLQVYTTRELLPCFSGFAPTAAPFSACSDSRAITVFFSKHADVRGAEAKAIEDEIYRARADAGLLSKGGSVDSSPAEVVVVLHSAREADFGAVAVAGTVRCALPLDLGHDFNRKLWPFSESCAVNASSLRKFVDFVKAKSTAM